MQRLDVSGAVRLIYKSLGVKGLMHKFLYKLLNKIDTYTHPLGWSFLVMIARYLKQYGIA